jgi:ribosomal protein S18 acetylase RimI-like enzyme
MQIERAALSAALGVMQVITLCVAHMRAQGIYQWDEIYPNLQVVEEGARSGSLFVIRQEGGCVASVCLNELQPEQYRSLPWRCTQGRALVIHRLCVHPEWQRRGAGRHLMDFTESFAREHGFSGLRLDCYTGNPRALALYERRGYQRVVQASFPRRELPFDCFEKMIMP